MRRRSLPYFHAIQSTYLYRVYVTSSDLICIRLGKGPVPPAEAPGTGLLSRIIGMLIGAGPGIILIGVRVFLNIKSVQAAQEGQPPGSPGLNGLSLAAVFVGAAIGIGIAKLLQLNQRDTVIDESSRFNKNVEEEIAAFAHRDENGIRDYVAEKRRGYILDPDAIEAARIDRVGKWKWLFLVTPPPALIVQHPGKGKCVLVFQRRLDTVTALSEVHRLLGDDLDIASSMSEYDKPVKKYEKTRDA